MKKHQSFSEALDAVKRGYRVSREGWNGKGMFVFLHKGSHDFQPPLTPHQIATHPLIIEGIASVFFDSGDTGTATRLPCLNMHNANGRTVNGWLASQTDLLAEDWCILDGLVGD